MFIEMKTRAIQKSAKAFSLLEIVVAVGIFAILSATLLVSVSGIAFNVNNSEDRLAARYLTLEAQEALRSIRDYSWDALVEGTYGLDSLSNGYWELSGSNDTYDKFTRTVELTELSSLQYEGVITVTWTTDEGSPQSLVATQRLTNWEALFFFVDTQADFEEGFFNSTVSTVSGTVELASMATNWTDFSEIVTQDTVGVQNVRALAMQDDFLYMSTALNISGAEFFVFDVSDVTGGESITLLGSLNLLADVNDIAIQGGYAFLAMESSLGELGVVDLSDFSLVQIVDLNGTSAAHGIAITGNTAVISRDSQAEPELFMMDISNPESSITELASVELGAGTFYDVALNDGYAFVVSTENTAELQVVRLSDNTVQNTVNMNSNSDAISITIDPDNDLAYVGRTGSDEFTEFDISNPETFDTGDITGSQNLNGNVNDIFIFDGKAFVASDGNADQIEVIDLSDYSLESTLDLAPNGDGSAVWVQGAHVYVGMDAVATELSVLESNVSGGGWESIQSVGTVNMSGSRDAYSITVEGDYAYVGRDSTGTCNTGTGANCEFLIYDISTSSAASFVGAAEIGGDVQDIGLSGNYAYLATDSNSAEFVIVDISTKSAPSVVGTYNAPGNFDANGVAVSGSFAYLARDVDSGTCNAVSGSNCELFVLNVSVPALPVLTTALELGDSAWDVVVNGNELYVSSDGDSTELRVVDISTPATSSILGTYDHPGSGNGKGIFYDGTDDTLHMTFLNNGANGDYSILDVSTPASPALLGSYVLGQDVFDVTLISSADLAFLSTGDGGSEFQVVDISTQSNPAQISSFNATGTLYQIGTDGTNVYVVSSDNSEEIQIFGPSAAASTVYSSWGIYTTKAFDSGSSLTSWGPMQWTSSGTGTVQLKTRTASSAANLNLATWVGPDGTEDTFYTVSGSTVQIHSGATGTQWFQIAAYLEGDTSTTPVLEDMNVSYSQ